MVCASTVRSVTNRRAAIARLESPSATSDEDLTLTCGQLRQRIVAPSAAEEPRDDRRIDDGLAIVDATQRVNEHGDVEDALLQEISDPLGMLLEEPQRVARLHVLREDKHADAGVLRTDPLGGDQALVACASGAF